MKIFICILALAIAVNGDLASYLESPPDVHLLHQVTETKIVNVNQTTLSHPHATLPTQPMKFVKLIQNSVLKLKDLPASSAVSHSNADQSLVPPPKVQTDDIFNPAIGPVSIKLLKVIREYFPKYYNAASLGRHTKILKIANQIPVSPHHGSVVKNARLKHFDSDGHSLVSGYTDSISHATPSPAVKVIVLQKPAAYRSW